MKACEHCGKIHEGIGGYYDRIDCQQRAARKRWEDETDPAKKRKLWEAYIDAGNTGD